MHCVEGNLRCLDDGAEDRTPPGPGAVSDDVDRVGDEWSVVCVKLARVVTGTVVVRVADRRQRTVDHLSLIHI